MSSFSAALLSLQSYFMYFMYFLLLVLLLSPLNSYAQPAVPYWLSPTWIERKLSDFHARNIARYENSQANNEATAGESQPKAVNSQSQSQSPSQKSEASKATSVTKAPVETAVPKMNEKYLTPEELKELRRQLKQQR